MFMHVDTQFYFLCCLGECLCIFKGHNNHQLLGITCTYVRMNEKAHEPLHIRMNTYVRMCVHMCVHMFVCIQWNLSITDTLGTKKQFVVQRFPLFRGYLICTAIYLVPQKQFVKRGFTVYIFMHVHMYRARNSCLPSAIFRTKHEYG